MPENKNIAVVKEWIDASNAHDIERIGMTLHSDYEYDYSNTSIKGKKEAIEEWKLFLVGLPDLHYEAEQIIDGGEYIVARIKMTATQKGELKFVGTDSLE